MIASSLFLRRALLADELREATMAIAQELGELS